MSVPNSEWSVWRQMIQLPSNADESLLICVSMGSCKNGIIYGNAMSKKKEKIQRMRSSAEYPRGREFGGKSTRAYRHIHFAVMAIENAAKRMKIPSWEMYRRLKAQNLIHNRLLSHYDALHTQGIDWVAEDTVETLLNWEATK